METVADHVESRPFARFPGIAQTHHSRRAVAVRHRLRRSERPQLLEIVLQRRSGQRQALAGADLPDAFRDGRGRVLHRLRLVQYGGVVVVAEQRFMIPVQQRVGPDDQMAVGDIRVVVGPGFDKAVLVRVLRGVRSAS